MKIMRYRALTEKWNAR